METVLMSIDSSTRSTGVGIFKNGKLSERLLIDSRYNGTKLSNLDFMISELYRVINEYKPDIIVVELTAVQRNAQAQRNLTMILGAIKGKCLVEDIFWHAYRPSEWRAIVKDKDEKLPRCRTDLKTWACERILRNYGITEIDDVCEAILIGDAYIKQFSNDKKE